MSTEKKSKYEYRISGQLHLANICGVNLVQTSSNKFYLDIGGSIITPILTAKELYLFILGYNSLSYIRR